MSSITATSTTAADAKEFQDRFTHLLCIWSGPVVVVLTVLGMVVFGRYIFPATDPAATGEVIQAFYVDNLFGTRFGLLLLLVAFSLVVPFSVAISLQLRRIEQTPAMSWTNLVAGTTGAIEGIMAVLIWMVCAFRPAEIDPDITRAFHDLGWLVFLIDVPIFQIWLTAIGVAILRDKNQVPLFPRWFGYYCIWVAVLLFPAWAIIFFKAGPFAYDGVLALYLPFAFFFSWMLMMTWYLFKALNRKL